MSRTESIQFNSLGVPFDTRFSDGHLRLQLEYFADRVENNIQIALMSELMTRYTDVSAQLEEKNRELSLSDATRLEAQKIAMLGNWNYNLTTRTLALSETMYDILEQAPVEQLSLQAYLSRIYPDDLPTVNSYIDLVRRGEIPTTAPHRLVMADGRIKWIITHLLGIRDANRKLTAIHGTVQDITASKLAEETLQKYNDHLEELVQEKVREIFNAQMATIYALVKLAESRDDDTGEHIERTSRYCGLLAQKAKEHSPYSAEIDDQFVQNIALASPLHGIGKVGIPDRILLKPGKLTPDEFEIMKTHVTIGYDTLASLQKMYPGNAFLRIGMDITRYHHEKWNGGGYRAGLSGTDIPLSARIMAVSDVYDALRAHRVYKQPFTHEESVRIMQDGRGTHFDPILIDLFLENQEGFREIFDNSGQFKN